MSRVIGQSLSMGSPDALDEILHLCVRQAEKEARQIGTHTNDGLQTMHAPLESQGSSIISSNARKFLRVWHLDALFSLEKKTYPGKESAYKGRNTCTSPPSCWRYVQWDILFVEDGVLHKKKPRKKLDQGK